MFEVGQRVKVLVDKAFNGKRGMLGREGAVLDNASSSDVVTYVKLDGANTDERAVFGKRMACEVFGNEHLELVEAKEEENMQEIKVGDTVEVIDTSGGHGKKLGETFKVKAIEQDRYSFKTLIVLDDPSRARTAAYAERFKVVQPKPSKAKSRKISIDEVQVGDEIVAFRNSSGVETRRKGVVGKIVDGVARTEQGNILTHFYNSAGGIYPAHHVYLLNRPEPKKPEIEDGVYYVTSTMKNVGPWQVTVSNEVAVWKYGKDWQHQAKGAYELLLETMHGKNAYTFHTEDPTPKGFDALDKSKTYFLKSEAGDFDWYLAYVDGSWKYGYKGNPNTYAYGFERQFTEGTSSWEKPVERVEPELTDLEKFEQAGYVGKKFRGWATYKVTRKGNVKYLSDGYWNNSDHNADTFIKAVEGGRFIEI